MLADAEADSLLDTLTPDPDGVPALLARKQIQTVTFEGWRRIDAVEMAAGEERGNPGKNSRHVLSCWLRQTERVASEAQDVRGLSPR